MKLLYLTFIETSDPMQIGILSKLKGQIKAFEAEFDKVYYTNYEAGVFQINESMNQVNSIDILNSISYKILRMRSYYPRILQYIKINKIDVIYIRYFMSDPFFLIFLLKCKKMGAKVLIEIPTYPYLMEIPSASKRVVESISVLFLKKLVDRIVTFSEHKEIFGIKTIHINNGIDINSISVKKHNKGNPKINLIGVANVSEWHGYDRVINGLYNYYSNKHDYDVVFNIVGQGKELVNLKELVETKQMNSSVLFHGVKSGESLDEVFNNSHIGIGSLANHRKGLNLDSALKNREYCAKGIPFVVASEDLDFPIDFKYIYRVERNESPIDINEIISFFLNVFDDQTSKTMRLYANEKLSWQSKLSEVINYCYES